jgi:hypothetical protein
MPFILRVLGGERIKDDGDEGSDVLDHNNLSMEVGNHTREEVLSLGEDMLLFASGTPTFWAVSS